ncbi:hypothetical protein EJB05_29353, partial [Eragrostis curvula]
MAHVASGGARDRGALNGWQGCILDPSLSRVRSQGVVGETLVSVSPWNKSSIYFARLVGTPVWCQRQDCGGGAMEAAPLEEWVMLAFCFKDVDKVVRVGPGSSIDIWEDNWLPGIDTLKPRVRLEEAQVAMVNELFIPGTRVWNQILVKESFIAMDAEEVLKVMPPIHGDSEFYAWAFEKNGYYSVRSAYRVLKKEAEQRQVLKENVGATSDGSHWRRHVTRESYCEACGDPSESLHHVAMECTYARRFWEAVRETTGVKLPALHPMTWAKDILSGHFCSGDDANLIVCGVWSLWTGRNARNHGAKQWSPSAAARHVAKLLEDLVCMKEDTTPQQVRRHERWIPPDTGWVKVNSDGAFLMNTSTGASGVIVRNERGDTPAVEGRWMEHLPDALTAEASAARHGLSLAVALGYDKVILEVDNSSLATSIRTDAPNLSTISGLCQEIKELGRSFVDFNVSLVGREANSAAHCCGKMPTSSNRVCSCVGYTPDWLHGVVTNDCNSVEF